MAGERTWQRIGIAVFLISGVLLVSYGGAIVAAPVTLPLMYVAVRRHPTRAFRVTGSVLGALTTAELAWALTYLAIREATPWIWLTPLLASLAAVAAFATATTRERLPHNIDLKA